MKILLNYKLCGLLKSETEPTLVGKFVAACPLGTEKVGTFSHCLQFVSTARRVNLFSKRQVPSVWQVLVSTEELELYNSV